MIVTYLNYKFKNSGITKYKQKLDKRIFLSSNLDHDVVNKINYRPEYRSHIKRQSEFEVGMHFRNIKNGLLQEAKNNKHYWYKPLIHIKNMYAVKDDQITYTQIIQQFMYNYSVIANRLENKKELYKHIKIPKRKIVNGKQEYRHLHEPVPELKELQNQAKFIIENIIRLTPHNASHAYFKQRDNVTNAEQHKYSKHIINIDLKDFFPSITPLLIKDSLISFKEFSLLQTHREKLDSYDIVEIYDLQNNLINAIIDVATYDNSLPQGSPLSPLLSNLIMFRFDHHMQNTLIRSVNDFSESTIMYTRYADDLTFSSMYPINLDNILERVEKYLIKYVHGIRINKNKIKYLKTTRRCYITGVKLNKDKDITYGHEKKAELKRELFKLFMMYQANNKNTKEAQETIGRISYLRRVEPKYADILIDKYCKKFNVPTKNFYHYFLN